jgi:hypothetical protein
VVSIYRCSQYWLSTTQYYWDWDMIFLKKVSWIQKNKFKKIKSEFEFEFEIENWKLKIKKYIYFFEKKWNFWNFKPIFLLNFWHLWHTSQSQYWLHLYIFDTTCLTPGIIRKWSYFWSSWYLRYSKLDSASGRYWRVALYIIALHWQ